MQNRGHCDARYRLDYTQRAHNVPSDTACSPACRELPIRKNTADVRLGKIHNEGIGDTRPHITERSPNVH